MKRMNGIMNIIRKKREILAVMILILGLACAGCQRKETEFRNSGNPENTTLEESTDASNGETRLPEEGAGSEAGDTGIFREEPNGDDSWMKTAWAKFDDYSKVDSDAEVGIACEGGYTGFMDCLPWEKYEYSSNPYEPCDVDGDGKKDRVYRREENGIIEFYLFLSSGETILLDKKEPYLWDQYGVSGGDLTGDGQWEILCTKINQTSTDPGYVFSLYQRKDGTWKLVDLPGSDHLPMSSLTMTVILQRIDDDHLKISHPESGASKVIASDINVSLWDGTADSVMLKEWTMSSNEIAILTDPNTGKSMLRVEWMLLRRMSGVCVVGNLVYEEGEWTIQDVLIGGFRELSNYWIWRLDVDKTREELKGSRSLGELIGVSENSGEDDYGTGMEPFMGIRKNGIIYSEWLSDSPNGVWGWCEISDTLSPETDVITVHLFPEGQRDGSPDTVTMQLVTEKENSWLVMDYKGEKLYWRQ